MATSVTGLGPGLCPVDGVPLLVRRSGNPPTFCSARCRKRAQRARLAGKAPAARPQPVLAAPRRLPARRELVPGRSATTATGRQAALAAMLAAGGYAVNLEARRGMCVIVTITGLYEERV